MSTDTITTATTTAAVTTPGAPCWIELFTPDTEGARRFYAELFGWIPLEASAEFGGYFMFEHAGAPIAGCMPNDGDMGPSAWSTYLYTADVAASVAAVTEHGGRVDVEPMPVADVGTMAWIADPTGGSVGLWQPGTHPGFLTLREPGSPAWFELLTDRYDVAVPFYRDALGWDVQPHSDTPELRYSTLGAADDALAGIQDAAELLDGAPSRWQVLFAVADTDASVELAVALGGSVVSAPEDSPYGRIAEVRDPAGVAFGLMGPNLA